MREGREEGGEWLVSPSVVSLHPKAPTTHLQTYMSNEIREGREGEIREEG